ncbi:MAG TPA: hypothetical protein VNZ45_04745, partial [Bacteroidia bacterium]|nr:hypothetical protein [Bacteroidia bacterium]
MRGRRIKTAVSLSLVSALGAAGVTAWLVSSSSGDRSAGRPGLPGAAALPSADRPTLVDPNSFTANPATYQGREVVMLLPQTLFAPITNVRTVNIPGTTGEKSEQYIEVGQLGTPPLRGSVPVLLPEGSDGKL